MKYRNWCIALLLFCVLPLWAARATNDYAIKIKAPDLKLDKIFLGNYYMGKLYVQDSLQLDKKGNGVFTAEKKLPEGMYVLYLKSGKYADLLIGDDQTFSVQLDTMQMAQNMVLEGASQSVDFANYTKFLAAKQAELNKLQEQYKEASEDDKKALSEQMASLSESVRAKQNELINTYPNGMLGLFIKGLMVPELPEWTNTDNCANVDSCKAMHRYLFYKNHYLDNLALSDVRTYRTPYINNTLTTYLDKVLLQINDSIIPSALQMIERSKGNDTTFQIMASHVLNYSVKSKIMGMDNLLVEVGKRYYLSGEATWADSTLLANITNEINKIERSLVGMKAHNIYLSDANGMYKSLYDMGGSQITVLYFYEPSCGHCRKTTPVLAEFAKKYKDDPRIKIVAVYMLEDKEEWQQFVTKHDMSALVNVWDPKRVSNYWYWYDTSTTPMMYVMDADHSIFAKKIDIPTLELIAKHELK
ncbi:MAG: redoxin domain-containing protein [Paludibacteraceae bacterium]|nr:redoxin domain-containing protein [Paludibacteraceae bacterium]